MKYIWRDGAVLPYAPNDGVDLYWSATRYGVVLFDAMWGEALDNRTQVFRPSTHLCRFQSGLAALHLDTRFTVELLIAGLREVIAANKPTGKFGIRVFACGNSRGFLGRDCSTFMFVMDLNEVSLGDNVALHTGSECVYEPTAIGADVKCTCHYVNKRVAVLDCCQSTGVHYNDVIFTDRHGMVTETSKANVFLLSKGCLSTPHCSAAMLNGITRQSVLEYLGSFAPDYLESVQVRAVHWSELLSADELFLTSTSLGVLPVTSLNGRPLDTSTTKLIRTGFESYTEAKEEWLLRF